MSKCLVFGAMLCALTRVAGADTVPWDPGIDSSVRAGAFDDGAWDQGFTYFDAFSTVGNPYVAQRVKGDSSQTTSLDWFSNSATTTYSGAISDTDDGFAEGVIGGTQLFFQATRNVNFEFSQTFTWEGSANSLNISVNLVEIEALGGRGLLINQSDTIYDGPGTLTQSGSVQLLAGRYYDLQYSAYVSGIHTSGTGTGTGGFITSVVPLPSASALAGLGLLGLSVRRRRSSL